MPDSRTRLIELRAAERLSARDASLFADPVIAADRLGWVGAPALAAAGAHAGAGFAAIVKTRGITDVVLLGMGGSSLAPLVLSRAIGGAPGFPTLHVLDTSSPDQVSALLAVLRPATTLVIVASKSGTTIEPLSLAAVFGSWMRPELGDDTSSHFAAITDPGSPLEALATAEGYAAVIHAPADVGGRYAALTPFSTVPAALIGVDVDRLIAAAGEAEDTCRTSGSDNPALALAAWMADAYTGGRDKLTLVCSPAIASFGLWVEQLIAESTGKSGRGVLPVLEVAPGDPAAHGADRLTFVLRSASDDSLASLVSALPTGEPVFEVILEDVHDLGREFVRWEWAVALFSVLEGIEPFDQPDVEGAKATTRAILAGTRTAPEPSLIEGGIAITRLPGSDAGDLTEAISALLAHARAGSYLAVLAYLPEDEALLAPLREACAIVARAMKLAVTFELGPRYLHSTGQYHKGGPDGGIFLVVTACDSTDIPVDAQPFTLSDLHAAQAAGEVATLTSLGRPVVAARLPHADAAGVHALAEALRSAVR